MIKKLLVLTPAAMIVCSFAVSPVFADTVIVKHDHRHHEVFHHHHHDDKKVIIKHHD
jgi:hypothetical protein